MGKKQNSNNPWDIYIQPLNKYLRICFFTILSFLLLLMAGCFQLPVILMQQDAVNKYLYYNPIFINKFFVHENPKVGDYAIFRSAYNDYKLWEIIQINTDTIVIKFSLNMANPVQEYSLYDYEYSIDYKGKIEKIECIGRKNGKKKPVPVPQPGDKNYHLWTYSHDEMVVIPAGSFNTQLFWTSRQTGAEDYICYVSYYNSEVAMCNVKTIIFSGNKIGARFEIKKLYGTSELIEYGNRVNHRSPSYLWIFDF